ncbi:transporter substrate-binding domain-containing protein [Paenibacillus sepulcri]|uniref:Transporter substrate-binding domain-containing protein n=1 Tax=Paenibacillus sepulcri TaxID=359917 RepID=A0ABS7C1W6_9BACL|nr:transporter substrate-binding domain-containing protein [Paenibacillus sepulcri]
MKSKRTLWFAALGLMLLLTACGANNTNNSGNTAGEPSTAGSADSASEQTVIKVATYNVPSPFFSFFDENNQRVGYLEDYLKALEEKLPEYKFEYESVDWDSMLIGTDTGKYAFMASNVFKTPEREEKYIYPKKEFVYSLISLLTRTDRDDIKTLDDVVGKKLVPMVPTDGMRVVVDDYNKAHPDNTIKIENIDKRTTADVFNFLRTKQYDTSISLSLNFQGATEEERKDLKISAMVSKEPAYLLFNKKQGALADKVDAVTDELTKDGTLSKLSEKWFGVDVFKSIDEINASSTN